MSASRRPAVFLDRDGTLNREVDFLKTPEELELLPGVPEALRQLADAGYALVVVSNQSGVARGYLSEETLAEIHARLERELDEAAGVTLDRIAYCPHHPTEGEAPYRKDCDCRKPRPGLLARAIEELALDPEQSFIIGDSARDLAAGAALGIPGILVATGKGAAERTRVMESEAAGSAFVDDLRAAATVILSSR